MMLPLILQKDGSYQKVSSAVNLQQLHP